MITLQSVEGHRVESYLQQNVEQMINGMKFLYIDRWSLSILIMLILDFESQSYTLYNCILNLKMFQTYHSAII